MKEVFKQLKWYFYLPFIFLMIALYITFNVWSTEYKAEEEHARFDFYSQHSEKANQLLKQLTLFDQSLHSVSSFFDNSDYVSENEFKYFASNILNSNFSFGLESISFAKYVNLSDTHSYHLIDPTIIDQLHASSESDKSQSQSHAPIVYSVQKSAAPEAPVTFLSAFDNEQVKNDMLLSAKNGTTLISETVSFDHSTVSCHCLSMIKTIYYHTDGAINRNKIHGWLISKINFDALFLESEATAQRNIQYALYQGLEKSDSTLLYKTPVNAQVANSSTPSFMHDKYLDIHGQQWLLVSESLPLFDAGVSHDNSTKIGLLGLLFSTALSAMLYFLFAKFRATDQLKAVSEKLKLRDDAWQFALEGSGDGVFDWGIKSKQITFSKVWKEMLGYDGEYFVGAFTSWKVLVHPDDYMAVNKAVDAILYGRNSHISVEARLRCQDGDYKSALLRGMVVSRDADGEAERLVGTSTDLSELKRSEVAIWQHANFDSLTNLPNRNMMHTRIEQEIKKCDQSGLQFAILSIDLDKFKEVNEALGHDRGDLLIQLAGQRLQAQIDVRNTVSALGGASFMVLMSDIESSKLSNLDAIAQKLLQSLAAPFELDGEKAFVTASVGMAIFPNDARDIVALNTCVDHALSAAKKKGGNFSSYFKQDMQAHAVNRMQLANDLRTAVQNDELFLTYQPIVDLQSDEIYKAEALIRWQHPEKGLIPPFDFIPIAEETRLINEIGDWVFGQAIKQSLAWREHFDQRFQIAVNKSPIQFLDNDYSQPNWTRNLLNQANAQNGIVVEVTEGLLLEASGQVFGWLEYYKQNNIQISLDDFGTGYSSLSYLKKFDMDFLKIDRSFVSNLETSQDDQALCYAIIAMAHSLGIKVIAEGIETEGQRDILLKAGCDFGQGYYYSKPVVAKEFEAMVKLRNEKPALERIA
jgi:diguanylate cyclase (GGDEF)-like protein/PAS domain S-box-containing protein